MILRFDKLCRTFRRLSRLMLISQLLSPFVCTLVLLVATVLGINTDEVDPLSPELLATEDRIMVETNGEPILSCCNFPVNRTCPTDTTHTGMRRQGRCKANKQTSCSDLSLDCLHCTCDYSCQYGQKSRALCEVMSESVECVGKRKFEREFTCSYCYLTPEPLCSTSLATSCISTDPATKRSHWYVASCSSSKEHLCLGSPRFSKKIECNWTEGYSYKTALILSVTLGGFGADRFYLGYWQEGIGKLFSFGGLGVWTLVDVILVGVRYIGPADGSLYI